MPKIIELKPIKETTQEYEEIEVRIKRAFRELLYYPLLKQLKISRTKLKNARNDLLEALQSGRITYSLGAFRGKFSASISKELRAVGSKWDRKSSTFKINQEDLPYEIREAIASSSVYFTSRLADIDRELAKLLPEEISGKIKITDLFDKTLWKVEKEFQKSIKNLTVSPQLTAAQRAKIAEEWQKNMDLWIQDFSEKEIKNLRKTVQDSAFSGNRFESLEKGIKDSYGVTSRKAKFLARQETNLLMAKFKETRYTSAGVNEYRWGCVKMPHDTSPDPKKHVLGNVRYYHGILEGQIFRWDDPPVTNKNPERRNNPGQDYNCRCFPRPIVKFRD